ncbi:hypothetical protein CK503_07170 [Aliifodinibius salipaludis]|uniref:Uncharacterized protein n=1 Tax=Fodinibius salipaludis TaxID=2032627 RepID=A0A2A2GCF1_9BACT|nr:DUF6339 family protein [Aliifodinibius salipaludis]PAU94567.1 hypothetical protein CK503_07170 [Aliifodinibius salipaludis]
MKENIQILSKECCSQLLDFQSSEDLRKEYNKASFNTKHLEFLNIPTDYYIDKNLELPTGSKKDRSTADCESSIKIFQELKNLTPVQANDKRLWLSLTHDRFFSYTIRRWGIDSSTSANTIIDRFFFEGASIETRMRNSISRLWWAAKLTYDPNRKDEFELTKLLWSKQDLFQGLVERTFGTYENVVKAFLQIYADNNQLTEDQLRDLYKSLNSIGGVKLLSALSYKEVKSELQLIANHKNIELYA